jgi:uncharacterized protein YndB with AHSA1/START domain
MTAARSDAMKVTTPSDREIVLTRDFDAPRALVFDAFTQPEHLARWWGLRDSTLSVCDVDLRVGGAWRFVTRGSDGHENAFKGEYREIVRPAKLVYTFIYDMPGYRDDGGLVTDDFEDRGVRTTLVETMLFPTAQHRDGMLKSGMQEGAAETFDRLAELLATIVGR